jgi:ketosteroid isomerase-like protein
MSAEDNKKVVLSFFENFSAGKAEAALGQMADNATWTVMGKPESFALAGTKTKAQFTELLKGIGAAMPKGLASLQKR